MNYPTTTRATPQSLALARLPVWLKVLRSNSRAEARFARHALTVTLLNLANAPLRLYENVRFARAIAQQPLAASPIFILGHWRSGTTFLHRLMSRDPRLGYASYLQIFAANQFLGSGALMQWVLGQMLPETRPMDNVNVSLDEPFEEEIALANLSDLSYYHGWYFPEKLLPLFRKLVLLEGLSADERERLKQAYLWFLKKITLQQPDRQLVLKNPPNTARIPLLLEMFPDARFVHIYRNPCVVYHSTVNLYRKVLPMVAFQEMGDAEIERVVLQCYEQMMRRYLADRQLIPAANLIEVRYEELEARPLPVLEAIYAALDLPGFAEARPHFEQYLGSVAGYQKNRYPRQDGKLLARIYQHWQFAFERWGYEPPEQVRC